MANKGNIKVICSFCESINDAPIELFDDREGYKCLMTNGLVDCWYCGKSFWWEMSEETIKEIFKNDRKTEKNKGVL